MVVILGRNFCDSHVEAIQPRKQVIELADGATIRILKMPQKRSKDMVPIPGNQEYIALKCRKNHKVFGGKTVILQSGSQNWETFSALRASLLQIEPYLKLYGTRQCPASQGIAQVKHRKDLIIIIANFGYKSITLLKGQQVATANTHPLVTIELPITHAEVFGINENERHTYEKRYFSAHDTVLIKKYFADSCNSHEKE